jgi:hypothetical protein
MPVVIAKARNNVFRACAPTKSPGAILDDAVGVGPQGGGQDARIKPIREATLRGHVSL